MDSPLGVLASACLVVVAVAPVRAQAPTFTSLALDETGYFSPVGVSADGNVVVGMAYVLGSGDVARRWRNGIGFDYPGPSSGPVANWASGISGSGSVISGGTGHAVFGDLEGWVRFGASVGHVGSPPGHDTSDCRGVSPDGAVIVGYGGIQSNPNLFQAASYREQSGWANLGFLVGGANSKALAASQNGAVIVGWSTDATVAYKTAFRRTSPGGMVPIAHLPGGDDAEALAVSADGSVVVGDDYVVDASFHSFQTAWRWSAATGTTSLGFLPGGSSSIALGVSDDGAVVVGTADSGGSWAAFVWDAQHGLRDLRTLLIAQGIDLSGWQLSSSTAIRGSGPWILVGDGAGPGANEGGWLVRLTSLDEPSSDGPYCFGDGSLPVACPCVAPNVVPDPPAANGHGCANSLDLNGALLSASGSTVPDTLTISVDVAPAYLGFGFLVKGNASNAGGIAASDGVRCVDGALIRFGSHNAGANGNPVGQWSYPNTAQTTPISTATLQPAGEVAYYQLYYRNAAAMFCTSATANWSNGLRVSWP